MRQRRQTVTLTDVSDDWDPALVNKKQAARSKTASERLQSTGYRFPSHWKHSATRPFVGWDGEGITYEGNKAQSYVLFGASTGDRISKPDLSTIDCLNLMLSVEVQHPDAIHVGFAFQYDVNMILRDLSRKYLLRLYHTHKCTWKGYRLEYRPGKWINVRYGSTTMRLFDVWGFFQSSFVTACEKFLGKDDPELDGIRKGKAARQSFTYDQLETFIVPYWEGELRLLVRLMDSLRDDLTDAGLPVASWHGPGAVANTVFRQHDISSHMNSEIPKEVNRAAQYAYAGGRFELFQAGHYPGTVWQYDINSAYPTAISQLLSLQAATWRYVKRFIPGSFGVWHIRYNDKRNVRHSFSAPNPLFYRDILGNVSYPQLVEGWYWTPEAALVDPEQIDGGWIATGTETTRPFAFVEEMYDRRQQWKSYGKSAEKALKLALNSLYGKMAQRTGWQQEGDPLPKWHQLEWAGFVTSTTRATLWEAMTVLSTEQQRTNPSLIIATETDAVFSTQPLPLPIGKGLGQWEVTEYKWLTYLQNGLYYGETKDGTLIEKYRGFDKGSLPYEKVAAWLADPSEPLFGMTTRFIGLGLALHTKAVWRSWSTDKRALRFGGGGKRAHVPAMCAACKQGVSLAEGLHPLTILTPGGKSYPHRLPWLSDSESELRKLDNLQRW